LRYKAESARLTQWRALEATEPCNRKALDGLQGQRLPRLKLRVPQQAALSIGATALSIFHEGGARYCLSAANARESLLAVT
jgi:hypothetical protein